MKTSDIRRLPREGADGAPAPLVPEALVPNAVAETAGPDFPGERLMVCLNPRLREERARKREDLLQATEETLSGIAAAAARGRPGPANRDRTVKALGRKASRRRVEKRFGVAVRDDGMDWARSPDRIAAEARLDGICVVRTSLDAGAVGPEAAVEALQIPRRRGARVPEREGRPPHPPGPRVHSADRVRAARVPVHAGAARGVAHAPAPGADAVRGRRPRGRKGAAELAGRNRQGSRSSAKAKAGTKRTPDGLPVHSFRTLLADLSGVVLNRVRLPGRGDSLLSAAARPTPVQERAFELLGVGHDQDVPMRMPG